MAKKKHKAKNAKKQQKVQDLADLSLTDKQIEDQNDETPTTPDVDEDADETDESNPQEEPIQEAKSNKGHQDHFIVTDAQHPKSRWYVVHTYSGHEANVARTLIQRVQALNLENRFFEIFLPTQEKIQIKQGKREKVNEKVFPGYMLVRMILDDDSWFAVRSTQGITGFVGTGNKPTPISPSEVEAIRKFSQQAAPKHKATFSVGEAIRISDGPFSDFLGTVDSIDEERGKLKVLVSIFGRETPVELDFLQVTKV